MSGAIGIERLAPGRYRTRTGGVIETAALGTVIIPPGYIWRVGVGRCIHPRPSHALRRAALVHDIAYDGPWTRAHLRQADRAFVEVYRCEGGRRRWVPILWAALRAWAALTVMARRKPRSRPSTDLDKGKDRRRQFRKSGVMPGPQAAGQRAGARRGPNAGPPPHTKPAPKTR